MVIFPIIQKPFWSLKPKWSWGEDERDLPIETAFCPTSSIFSRPESVWRVRLGRQAKTSSTGRNEREYRSHIHDSPSNVPVRWYLYLHDNREEKPE